MDALIQIAIFGALLLGTYFSGEYFQRKHYVSILQREAETRDLPVVTFAEPFPDWHVESVDLVCGNVVVSLDYFKRFLAGLRAIVGGRIKSYEPLLDRARREAILRMKAQARWRGYNAIVNVRLETSRLASARGNGSGTAGVEVLAFGTALRVLRDR